MDAIVTSEFLKSMRCDFSLFNAFFYVLRGLCFVTRKLLILCVSLITAQNVLWFRLYVSSCIILFLYWRIKIFSLYIHGK